MTKNLPTRQQSRTDVGQYGVRYRWALAGANGVVELVVVDVLPLGRVAAEHLAVHSRAPFADADEFGECPTLGGANGHCTNYDLMGDKIARRWNDDRDDLPIWVQLAEVYGELPTTAVTA